MKIRLDPADKWFSKCVRERANWTCEHCLTPYPSGSGSVQCSHLFSRRHNATRYDPLNAFCHCVSCHIRLGSDPVNFTKWADSRLGPKKVESLYVRSGMTLKLSKVDKAFIAKHYQSEHRQMLAKRKAGQGGYLSFKSWGEG